MCDTTPIAVPKTAERIFTLMLLFYPEEYGKRYGNEMKLVFSDMYSEERSKNGKIGLGFWLHQFADIGKSVIEQHIDTLGKKGMKQYLQQILHINKYNVVGGIFLLPAFIVLCIDVVSRIVQGDLVHYNRPVYSFMSHTPLYWYPVLFTWVIIFPFLAVVINLIPLVKNISKTHGKSKYMRFIAQNIITILLVSFAAFFILIVKFHDFGPCMLHGIARLGFEHLTKIVAICRNA